MRAEALVLYATNTGSLYQEHLTMARSQAADSAWASTSPWQRHIVKKVLPAYRKEMSEPWEGMSLVDIEKAANELATYYAEHIAEGA